MLCADRTLLQCGCTTSGTEQLCAPHNRCGQACAPNRIRLLMQALAQHRVHAVTSHSQMRPCFSNLACVILVPDPRNRVRLMFVKVSPFSCDQAHCHTLSEDDARTGGCPVSQLLHKPADEMFAAL